MASIRAKFLVLAIEEGISTVDGQKFSESVKMIPVYSPDPNHENRRFWRATPSGMLDMYVENPTAFGTFQRGQQYYLDFTLAE